MKSPVSPREGTPPTGFCRLGPLTRLSGLGELRTDSLLNVASASSRARSSSLVLGTELRTAVRIQGSAESRLAIMARASTARSLIDWGARAPRPLFDAPSRRTTVVLAAEVPEAGVLPVSNDRISPRVKASWKRTQAWESEARRNNCVRRPIAFPSPQLSPLGRELTELSVCASCP